MDFVTQLVVTLCFLSSAARVYSYGNDVHDAISGGVGEFPIIDDDTVPEYPEEREQEAGPRPRPPRQINNDECKKFIGHELLAGNINTYTGIPFFISNFTESPLFRTIPAQQPQTCPPAVGSWWPGDEPHTRNNCPFVYKALDLGPSIYPKYGVHVRCLCAECINNRRGRCVFKRRRVNLLRLTGCTGQIPQYENISRLVIAECVCEEWTMNTVGFGPLPTE